jgi:hypothetical protein
LWRNNDQAIRLIRDRALGFRFIAFFLHSSVSKNVLCRYLTKLLV